MAGAAHSLVLTALPATGSSFPRRNVLFPASHRLPSAVKLVTLRSAVCVAHRRKHSPVRVCAQSQEVQLKLAFV